MLTRSKTRSQSNGEDGFQPERNGVYTVGNERCRLFGEFRLGDVVTCSKECVQVGSAYFAASVGPFGVYQLEEKQTTALSAHIDVFYRGRNAPAHAYINVYPPRYEV
mmetsp:Transcript_16588/g.18452  ORF Transcript_16588/g.18452 Transcript_16588/m.18452 type:complete len:107 (-) Transcript_16588:120-440(-)